MSATIVELYPLPSISEQRQYLRRRAAQHYRFARWLKRLICRVQAALMKGKAYIVDSLEDHGVKVPCSWAAVSKAWDYHATLVRRAQAFKLVARMI